MLGAADYINIDLVSTFFGKIVDTMYDNSESAPVMELILTYVGLSDYSEKGFSYSSWTVEELPNLEGQSNYFKRVNSTLFGAYQKSCMATCRWHVLSHIFDVIRHVGSIENLDAECFESSHNSYKKLCRKHQKIFELPRLISCRKARLTQLPKTFLRKAQKMSRNSSTVSSVIKDKTVLVCTEITALLDFLSAV